MKKPNACLNLIKFGQILGQILGKNRKKALILLKAQGKVYD